MIKKFVSKFEACRAQKFSLLYKGFVQNGQKILDLGSGSGHIAQRVQNNYGVKLVCVDIVDYNQTKLPLIIYDGKCIPFKNAMFDVVILSFVLHHATNPVQLLKEAKRVLRPEGIIIILEDIYYNRFELLVIIILHVIYDVTFNHVTTSFNFKTKKEWEKIFKELNLNTIYKRIFRSFFAPAIRHIQFVLPTSVSCASHKSCHHRTTTWSQISKILSILQIG